MGGTIWITSDWHFCHNRPFLWEPRGFKSEWEMNEAIITRYNTIVQPEDDVYVLGDLMLNNNEEGLQCIKQLKGNIHIIRGNHDSDTRMSLYNECYNIVEITEGQFLNYKNYHFYLSHYPCLCGNLDDNKPLKARTINICGHTHCQNRFKDMDKGLIYHAECDAHNCTPVSIEEVLKDIHYFISLDGKAQNVLCKKDIFKGSL